MILASEINRQYRFDIETLQNLPDSVKRYPRKGKCEKSPYMSGAHKTAHVPLYSLLDGGCAGDVCREMCVECGKVFSDTSFIPKNQPRTIAPNN